MRDPGGSRAAHTTRPSQPGQERRWRVKRLEFRAELLKIIAGYSWTVHQDRVQQVACEEKRPDIPVVSDCHGHPSSGAPDCSTLEVADASDSGHVHMTRPSFATAHEQRLHEHKTHARTRPARALQGHYEAMHRPTQRTQPSQACPHSQRPRHRAAAVRGCERHGAPWIGFSDRATILLRKSFRTSLGMVCTASPGGRRRWRIRKRHGEHSTRPSQPRQQPRGGMTASARNRRVGCGRSNDWFDKADPRAIFGDRRKTGETLTVTGPLAPRGRHAHAAHRARTCSWTSRAAVLGRAFRLVAFDPPHLERAARVAGLRPRLRRMLPRAGARGRAGLQVERDPGEAPLLAALTTEKPLFGQVSGRGGLTHWAGVHEAATHWGTRRAHEKRTDPVQRRTGALLSSLSTQHREACSPHGAEPWLQLRQPTKCGRHQEDIRCPQAGFGGVHRPRPDGCQWLIGGMATRRTTGTRTCAGRLSRKHCRPDAPRRTLVGEEIPASKLTGMRSRPSNKTLQRRGLGPMRWLAWPVCICPAPSKASGGETWRRLYEGKARYLFFGANDSRPCWPARRPRRAGGEDAPLDMRVVLPKWVAEFRGRRR
ncbi:hypothetical protein FQR65_LT19026 [Abscondita terminalis]|nr:hypothetical protein FQR65_LT19026 [Abscondita terminalis]